MTNLQNLVVFIKDEAELQQARERLEANGFTIDKRCFFLSDDVSLNYMYLPYTYPAWSLSEKMPDAKEITLTEIEQLLKQNRDETTQLT